MQLSWIDLSIILFYFIFVLSIGWYLKKFTKTGMDFFLAGKKCTSWVAGLSFLAANMGALELLGWSASAYQYGIIKRTGIGLALSLQCSFWVYL